MRTSLKKWGNSTGLVIPTGLLEDLGVKTGDSIEVTVVDGSLIMTPATPTYSLAELLKGLDPGCYEQSSDDTAWLGQSSVGAENVDD